MLTHPVVQSPSGEDEVMLARGWLHRDIAGRLVSDDCQVCEDACRVLGCAGSAADVHVQQLAQLQMHPDTSTRQAASHALRNLRKNNSPKLCSAIASADKLLAPMLAEALLSQDPLVRADACFGLGNSGKVQALNLQKFAQLQILDPNWAVRKVAEEAMQHLLDTDSQKLRVALASVRDDVVTHLESEDWAIRCRACGFFRCVGAVTVSCIQKLVWLLVLDPVCHVRAAARDSMTHQQKVDIPEFRSTIASAFANAVPTMIHGLLQEDASIRCDACRGLRFAGIAAAPHVNQLAALSILDLSKDVRQAARETMGRLRLMDVPELHAAISTAYAGMVSEMAEGLLSEDSDVRCDACYALGCSGHAVGPHVQELAQLGILDASKAVREAARGAIEQLEKLDDLEINTATACADANAIPTLVRALMSDTASVRRDACLGLGFVGSLAAPHMQQLARLQIIDPDSAVRQAASEAMDQFWQIGEQKV